MQIPKPALNNMATFVALDPAAGVKSKAGIAYFVDGMLTACAGVATGSSSKVIHAARCIRVAESLLGYCLGIKGFAPDAVVIEWPQIYTADKSPGDPNDLPPLAGVAMAFAGALSVFAGAAGRSVEVVSYLPREWTYGLSKSKKANPWASPRGNLIRLALAPAEMELAQGANHDCLDAIGIGLHHLRRLKPRRVIPR